MTSQCVRTYFYFFFFFFVYCDRDFGNNMLPFLV